MRNLNKGSKMEGVGKYIMLRTVVVDGIKLGVVYLAYLIITKPELLANWIKIVKGAFV